MFHHTDSPELSNKMAPKSDGIRGAFYHIIKVMRSNTVDQI